MEPTLCDGDWILVNKMILGARLFDIFAAVKNEEVSIYRIPTWRRLQRNDVLVFNFPYAKERYDSIRMNVMQYYVKRCIALPGDTVEIEKGFYKIHGYNGQLGNYQAQEYISSKQHLKEYGIIERTFPYDKGLGWTIKDFGPLPVPKRGQIVEMNLTTFFLYRQLIAWEQKKMIHIKDKQILLGDSLIYSYQFRDNYYFVSGDNMVNSHDSRYWGMLPEEYIVGKAICIWYSKDKYTGKTYWKRVMKKIK